MSKPRQRRFESAGRVCDWRGLNREKRGSAALTFTKHLRIMKQDGVSMKTLTLKNKFQTNATLLPNDFIDNYMVNANGEFIKVYLFLSAACRRRQSCADTFYDCRLSQQYGKRHLAGA